MREKGLGGGDGGGLTEEGLKIKCDGEVDG